MKMPPRAFARKRTIDLPIGWRVKATIAGDEPERKEWKLYVGSYHGVRKADRLERGGDAALKSYSGDLSNVSSADIEWLDSLPLMHVKQDFRNEERFGRIRDRTIGVEQKAVQNKMTPYQIAVRYPASSEREHSEGDGTSHFGAEQERRAGWRSTVANAASFADLTAAHLGVGRVRTGDHIPASSLGSGPIRRH